MNWVRWALVIYGIALIGIGAHGYFGPSGSMVSLIAGGAAGVLALVGVALSLKFFRWGYILVALVALGMLGRFTPDALDGVTYPALTIVVLSVVAIVVMAVGHITANKKPAEAA